jgi:hypothetical protein
LSTGIVEVYIRPDIIENENDASELDEDLLKFKN